MCRWRNITMKCTLSAAVLYYRSPYWGPMNQEKFTRFLLFLWFFMSFNSCLISMCVEHRPTCLLSTCITWRPVPRAVPSWWLPSWWALNSTWKSWIWWPMSTWNLNSSRSTRSTTSRPSTTMVSTWTRAGPFVLIWSINTGRTILSTRRMRLHVPWSINDSTLTWRVFYHRFSQVYVMIRHCLPVIRFWFCAFSVSVVPNLVWGSHQVWWESSKRVEWGPRFFRDFFGTDQIRCWRSFDDCWCRIAVLGFHLCGKYPVTIVAKISFIYVVQCSQVTDKTAFDKHPKTQSWLETCKAEIPEYEGVNGRGVEAFFVEWASAPLAKMKSSWASRFTTKSPFLLENVESGKKFKNNTSY